MSFGQILQHKHTICSKMRKFCSSSTIFCAEGVLFGQIKQHKRIGMCSKMRKFCGKSVLFGQIKQHKHAVYVGKVWKKQHNCTILCEKVHHLHKFCSPSVLFVQKVWDGSGIHGRKVVLHGQTITQNKFTLLHFLKTLKNQQEQMSTNRGFMCRGKTLYYTEVNKWGPNYMYKKRVVQDDGISTKMLPEPDEM